MLSRWQESARYLTHVEMEAGGAYIAARRGGPRGHEYPLLSVRGISDVVGFDRSPDWTAYACHSAASFVRALVASNAIELRPRHGTARRRRRAGTRRRLRVRTGTASPAAPSRTPTGCSPGCEMLIVARKRRRPTGPSLLESFESFFRRRWMFRSERAAGRAIIERLSAASSLLGGRRHARADPRATMKLCSLGASPKPQRRFGRGGQALPCAATRLLTSTVIILLVPHRNAACPPTYRSRRGRRATNLSTVPGISTTPPPAEEMS